MFLLGASLLFLPHYSLTLNQRPAFVTADVNGNAYVVSADPNQLSVGWLTKVDADGHVVYRVVLSHGLGAQGIVATPDAQGNVYAAVVAFNDPSADQVFNGSSKLWAVKLDPKGALLYSLPLGAPGGGFVSPPAVGPDGSAYFTGGQRPGWAPTTAGAWLSASAAAPNEMNAFVVKVSPAGDRIVYSTLLDNGPAAAGPAPGYPISTIGGGIAIDAAGSAYIIGTTNDAAYPTTQGAAQPQYNATQFGSSLFVSKLSPDGSRLVYSTFLGRSSLPISYFQPQFDTSGNLVVGTVLNGSTARLTTLLGDGSAIGSDYTIGPIGSSTAVTGLAVVPDGQGNLILAGKSSQMGGVPAPDRALGLVNGPVTLSVVRASDNANLYSTRLLPTGSMAYSQDQAVVGLAASGGGSFVVLGNAGAGAAAWTLTRFVREILPRPAVFGLSNLAVSYPSGSLAPGELIMIYGAGIGPAQPAAAAYDAGGRLPVMLAGTQVTINGTPAPIVSAADQQVVVEVPFSLKMDAGVQVGLVKDGDAANPAEAPVAALEPQLLQTPPDSSGASYLLALNGDGSVNSAANPAVGGTVLSLFLNGAGVLSPLPADGTSGTPDERLTAPVSVLATLGEHNGGAAQVLYAGAAPGLVGITQIDIPLPPPPYSRPVTGASMVYVTAGDSPTVSSAFWFRAQ